MPKVITITDDVYENLRTIKGDKSFSRLLRELIKKKKKRSKEDLLKFINLLEKGSKGRKEPLSERIDEVLYQ